MDSRINSLLQEGNSTYSLCKGTVTAAYPALNTYDVLPELGNPNSAVVTCTAISGSTTSIGIAGSSIYMPGTSVYFIKHHSQVNLQVAKKPYMHVILGAVPIVPIKSDVYKFPLYNLYNTTGIDYTTEQVTDAIINSRRLATVSTDMSYGIPMDTLAGDFVRAGSFGSYVSVTSSYAGVGGSRAARLEFFSFRQAARLTAETLEMNSPMSESGYRPDWSNSWLFYDRKAALVKEGVGMKDGADSAFITGKHRIDKFVPQKDTQQGIFRREAYFGNAVDGAWEFWELPELGGSNLVRTWEETDNPPFGVLSRRTGFDGSDAYRSFKGFSFVKSSFIPLVRELLPENSKPTESQAVTKQWVDDSENAETIKYYHHLVSSVERYETDYNVENYYNAQMRSRNKNWKVFNRSEVEDTYSINKSDYTSIGALSETELEYKKPGEFTGEDPGRETKYKAALLESMIKVLDDGTVVIGDGFGSEIRMARGTITITCPGDLKILPGRDLVEMTPRNRVLNTGRDLFMQSANGSVYVKAEENMSLLSGNKESGGITLIENRSTGAMVNDKWIVAQDSKEHAYNNGVLIKSVNSLGMVAKDMYIGVYDKNDQSDKGLDRSKQGNIIIDSAGGLLGLMGSYGYLKFKKNMMASVGEGSQVSLASMISSSINLYTRGSVGISTHAVNMVGGTGTVNVPELTKSGVVDNYVSFDGSDVLLNLQGTLQATVNGLFMGNLRASSVNAGDGKFGNGGQDDWGGGGSNPLPIMLTSILASSFGSAGATLKNISPSSNALYTGKCLHDMGFYYPGANVFKTDNFELVAAKWQHLMGTAGFLWNETVVTAPDGTKTQTYPGYAKWQEKVFVKLDPDGILRNKAKIMEKYIIMCSPTY